MRNVIEVLVPNRNGHEAIELCVRAIRARTRFIDCAITVLDVFGDGRDRPLLAAMEREGWIRLLRTGKDLRHGEALDVLFDACEARFAVIMESDVEVVAGGWLCVLLNALFSGEGNVAAARFFEPGAHGQTWFAPTWGPECAVFDMTRYATIREHGDWQQRSVLTADYPYRWIFDGMMEPEAYNGTVNLDTGWRFAEKTILANWRGLRVVPLPADFFTACVTHHGGLSTRGDRPEIQPRWARVRANLAALKKGS